MLMVLPCHYLLLHGVLEVDASVLGPQLVSDQDRLQTLEGRARRVQFVLHLQKSGPTSWDEYTSLGLVRLKRSLTTEKSCYRLRVDQ